MSSRRRKAKATSTSDNNKQHSKRRKRAAKTDADADASADEFPELTQTFDFSGSRSGSDKGVSEEDSEEDSDDDSDDSEEFYLDFSINKVSEKMVGKNKSHMIPQNPEAPVCIDHEELQLNGTSSLEDVQRCLEHFVEGECVRNKSNRIVVYLRATAGGKTRSTKIATEKFFRETIEALEVEEEQMTVVILVTTPTPTATAAAAAPTPTPTPTAPKAQVPHFLHCKIHENLLQLNKKSVAALPSNTSESFFSLQIDITSYLVPPSLRSHFKSKLPNKMAELSAASFFDEDGIRAMIVSAAHEKNSKIKNNSGMFSFQSRNGTAGTLILSASDLSERVNKVNSTACELHEGNSPADIVKVVIPFRFGFSAGSEQDGLGALLKEGDPIHPTPTMASLSISANHTTVVNASTAKSEYQPMYEKMRSLFFDDAFIWSHGFTDAQAKLFIKWKICANYSNYQKFKSDPNSEESKLMCQGINWDNFVMSPNQEEPPKKNAYPGATEIPTGTVVPTVGTEAAAKVMSESHAIANAMTTTASTNATTAIAVATLETSASMKIAILQSLSTGDPTGTAGVMRNRNKIIIVLQTYFSKLMTNVFEIDQPATPATPATYQVINPLPILPTKTFGTLWNNEDGVATEHFNHINEYLPLFKNLIAKLRSECSDFNSSSWIDLQAGVGDDVAEMIEAIDTFKNSNDKTAEVSPGHVWFGELASSF